MQLSVMQLKAQAVCLMLSLVLAACGGIEGDQANQRGTFIMPENIGKADSAYSCQGNCGQQASGGCWCDDQCALYGDCCPDIQEVCVSPVTAQEGEACGDDINVQCGEGLYCAFGLNRCGTPPVVGICRQMGDCGSEWDCKNEDNQWFHPMCAGEATCQAGKCGWTCDSPVAQEGDACGDDIEVQCGEGLYCAFGLNWCGTPPVVGICRQMGDCGAVSDCKNPDNQWYHPMCTGEPTCENETCGWQCM